MQKEKTKQMKKTAVKVTGLGKRYGSNQVLKEFPWKQSGENNLHYGKIRLRKNNPP